MPEENDPIEYAKEIAKVLDGVCYPVAKHSLEIAKILVEHQLNVEMSSVLAAGLPAAGS
jgi:hypothetical protein